MHVNMFIKIPFHFCLILKSHVYIHAIHVYIAMQTDVSDKVFVKQNNL